MIRILANDDQDPKESAGEMRGEIRCHSLTGHDMKIRGSGRDGSGHVLGSKVQCMYIVAAVLVDGIDNGLRFTPADPAARPHPQGLAKGLEVATASLGRSFDLGFL